MSFVYATFVSSDFNRDEGSNIHVAELTLLSYPSSGYLTLLPSSVPLPAELTLSTTDVAADDIGCLDTLDGDVKAVECNTIRASVVTAPVYWVLISSLSKRCSKASSAGVSGDSRPIRGSVWNLLCDVISRPVVLETAPAPFLEMKRAFNRDPIGYSIPGELLGIENYQQ